MNFAKFLSPLFPSHVRILFLQFLVLARGIVVYIFQLCVRLESDILLQSLLVIVLVIWVEPEEGIVQQVHVCGYGQLVLYALHYLLTLLAECIALGVGSVIVIFQFRECSDISACQADDDDEAVFEYFLLHAHDALFRIELEDGK